MPAAGPAYQQPSAIVIIAFAFVLASLTLQSLRNDDNIDPNLARTLPAFLKKSYAPFASNFIEVLEECCDWQALDDPAEATVVWTRSGQDVAVDGRRFGNGLLYSLVEGTDFMTDKAHLHALLRRIGRTELQPETYTLRDAEECREFFVRARAERGAVWVTKEPGAAQGAGIVVNPRVSELEEAYLKDPKGVVPECVSLGEDEDVVVQRYIMNPLLLNRKKMEIRSYWLLASVDPLVVFYHDGTVRLTTTDYTQADWDNPLIHITNTAQQKKADPNYYETQTERKWTLPQLAAYLEEHKKVPNGQAYLDNTLRPKLIDIIRTVVQGAHPLLMREKTKNGWDGRFELLGMDVILDDQLGVWLTEIQMGPGISRDPGVKQQTLPAMLEELMSIMLEVDQHMLKFGSVKKVNAAVTWIRVI